MSKRQVISPKSKFLRRLVLKNVFFLKDTALEAWIEMPDEITNIAIVGAEIYNHVDYKNRKSHIHVAMVINRKYRYAMHYGWKTVQWIKRYEEDMYNPINEDIDTTPRKELRQGWYPVGLMENDIGIIYDLLEHSDHHEAWIKEGKAMPRYAIAMVNEFQRETRLCINMYRSIEAGVMNTGASMTDITEQYILRDYKEEDFKDGTKFARGRCFICGHHIPLDQLYYATCINRHLHSNPQICATLIRERGLGHD